MQDSILKPDGKYCAYLRKSRLDLEAEAHGEGETLKRHEEALYRLAKKLHIVIMKTYREVVSADNIKDRPHMQELLTDTENNKWDGVLTMEIERLARGETMDQGRVAQVFKYSNTLIITPNKILDPSNEADQEYFEFDLFLARREYEHTKRRLNRGRRSSSLEGKYVGSVAPYGYKKCKLDNDKGFTLVFNDVEAEAVKLMYTLYLEQNLGLRKIAKELNKMNYKPRKGECWSTNAVKNIMSNPINYGMIRYNYRKDVKTYVNGSIKIVRPINTQDDLILVKGLHTGIIDENTWKKYKELSSTKTPRVPNNRKMSNTLAGLVVCQKCGRLMQKRGCKKTSNRICCTNIQCDNISTAYELLEEKILLQLEKFTKDLEFNSPINEYENRLNSLKKSIINLNNQLANEKKRLNKVCESYESGIYTQEIYLERSNILYQNINHINQSIEELKSEEHSLKEHIVNKDTIIPQIKNVLDVYKLADSVEKKNLLLKSVLEKVEYLKTEKACKDSDPTNFEITIYPKLKF